MISLLIPSALLLVSVQGQQIFENELSVALQPPPPPPELQVPSISKNDFSTIQFLSDTISATPIQQSVPIQPPQQAPTRPQQLAHHAVLFNAEQEAKLPPNLLNPFYKDPRIAESLAKQSWFGPGEKHVTDRESEKIPRDRIYYALKSAGLLRRRRSVLPIFAAF